MILEKIVEPIGEYGFFLSKRANFSFYSLDFDIYWFLDLRIMKTTYTGSWRGRERRWVLK